jgi:gamma-glutamylputrescine oxidase
MGVEGRGLRNQWGVAPWDRTSPAERIRPSEGARPKENPRSAERTTRSDRLRTGHRAEPAEGASALTVGDIHEVGTNPEVVIIGAGLTGLSTAYHLAKLGVRSVVLEAGLIADGASGRTGGLVLEGTAVGVMEQVDGCVEGLRRLVEAEQIDCSLHLAGCWEIEHRKDDAGTMLPWIDAGARIAIAKLISGGTVEPARLSLGLAHAAVAAGAVICEQTQVTKIVQARAPVAEIDQRRLHPQWVVVACNAWIDALCDEAPELTSSLTFACATEPLPEAVLRELGLGERIPFYTRDRPYLWGRTTDDRRIIFGTGLVFGKSTELEGIDTRSRDFKHEIDRMQLRVRQLHPALARVEFSNAWAGPIAFTEDGVPLLGAAPGCERIMVAGAYAGHGVALSVRAGELMANAIVHNTGLPAWGALQR